MGDTQVLPRNMLTVALGMQYLRVKLARVAFSFAAIVIRNNNKDKSINRQELSVSTGRIWLHGMLLVQVTLYMTSCGDT